MHPIKKIDEKIKGNIQTVPMTDIGIQPLMKFGQ